MATTGRMPARANPVAIVSACCSAMPTSKNRDENRAWNADSPVPVGMPAVMAQIRVSASARRTSSSAKTWV